MNSFGFVVGIEEDEFTDAAAFISYNLNTHCIYVFRIANERIVRKEIKEDKDFIYNLLDKVKEKLDFDLIEKEKSKVYKK